MALPTFDCFSAPAAFVIGAANRICDYGRGFGVLHAAALVLALLVVAGVVVAAHRRHAVFATGAAALALAAMVPGFVVAVFFRGDGPAAAASVAAHVRERMKTFSDARQGLACVDLGNDDTCVACQPLAEFVYEACDKPLAGPGGKVIFAPDAFEGGGCTRTAAVITCGGP